MGFMGSMGFPKLKGTYEVFNFPREVFKLSSGII